MEAIYLTYNHKGSRLYFRSEHRSSLFDSKLDETNEYAVKGFDGEQYRKTAKMFQEMSSTNGTHAQTITYNIQYMYVQAIQ